MNMTQLLHKLGFGLRSDMHSMMHTEVQGKAPSSVVITNAMC
jgi:hypothetical protein